MSYAELFLTAIALAMDAFAVSVTNGACVKKIKTSDCLIMGAYFGFFQFLMPILGFLLTFTFKNYIINFDHWIAFFLLLFIGAKMFKESFDKEEELCRTDIMSVKNLLTLAVATSIDAMAVGITLALTNTNIILSAVIIGIVAFIFSFFGVRLGSKIGEFFKSSAERLGGIVLVCIGLKILLEHTVFK